MSTIPINFTDLPAWAQEEVKRFAGQHVKRPTTRVSTHDGTVSVGGVWHEAYHQRIVGRNGKGEMMAITSGFYESLMNASPEEFHAYQGGKLGVPVDGAVLRIQTGPKTYVDFYVHKDGPYAHMVNVLGDGTQMTQVQMAVLALYIECTSSYRKEEINRHRIPVKLVTMVTEELQELGYVKINKRGAVMVTMNGRQAHEASRRKREWNWSQWQDCYDWRRRTMTGFAGLIIDEYKAKLQAQEVTA